jgi:hypothetical protein
MPARAGSVPMPQGRRGSERCYLSLGCAVELIPHEHKPIMAWARNGGGGRGEVARGGAERTSGGGVWAGRRAERSGGRAFKGELRVTMRLSFARLGSAWRAGDPSASDDVGPGRSAGASVTLAR